MRQHRAAVLKELQMQRTITSTLMGNCATKVFTLILLCICNSLRMAPPCRNMYELSTVYVWFISYCVHLLINITGYWTNT